MMILESIRSKPPVYLSSTLAERRLGLVATKRLSPHQTTPLCLPKGFMLFRERSWKRKELANSLLNLRNPLNICLNHMKTPLGKQELSYIFGFNLQPHHSVPETYLWIF